MKVMSVRNDNSAYRRRVYTLVLTAMLITMATALHVVEGFLPPLPVAGAKLGLANIITVAALVLLGPRLALSVSVTRSVLAALIGIGFGVGFVMSMSGALLSWAVMALLWHFWPQGFSLVGLSVAGAVGHNIAQLAVASYVLSHIGTMALLPWLLGLALPTGAMVGLAAGFLVAAVRKTSFARGA